MAALRYLPRAATCFVQATVRNTAVAPTHLMYTTIPELPSRVLVEVAEVVAEGEQPPFSLFYPPFPEAGRITRAGCKWFVLVPFGTGY